MTADTTRAALRWATAAERRPAVARWTRVASHVATGLGIALAVAYWFQLLGTEPVDLRYYHRPELSNLYADAALGPQNGTNYSPAFFQLVAPLGALPLDVLAGAYRAILLGLLVWMAGPFTIPLLLWYPVASEVNAANIQLLLAGAIVVGFRYPSAWAFVLLTKVTPGIGLLWFALRGQWRNLAIAAGTTAAVAGLSFALAPEAWLDWLRFLAQPAPAVGPWYWSFWERLPIAVAFLVLAGQRRWPVVVGATMALPAFYLLSPSMLVGAVYLARRSGRSAQP